MLTTYHSPTVWLPIRYKVNTFFSSDNGICDFFVSFLVILSGCRVFDIKRKNEEKKSYKKVIIILISFFATTIGNDFSLQSYRGGEHGKYRCAIWQFFCGSLPQFSVENRVLKDFYHFSPWQCSSKLGIAHLAWRNGSTKEHPNSLPLVHLPLSLFLARKIESRWLEQSSKTKGKETIKREQRKLVLYAEHEFLRWNIKEIQKREQRKFTYYAERELLRWNIKK